MRASKYHAAIFDMDGLLVGTELLAQLVWFTLARAKGFVVKAEDFRLFISKNMAECEALARQRFGDDFPYRELKRTRNEILPEFLQVYGAPVKPGVVDLLDFLQSHNYQLAVNTSSDRIAAEAILAKAELLDYFDILVTGDEAGKSKPDPAGYLLAAERLVQTPKCCLVFEDGLPGVRSARAAEMDVVMVPDMLEPDDFARQNTVAIFKSLAEVEPWLLEVA